MTNQPSGAASSNASWARGWRKRPIASPRRRPEAGGGAVAVALVTVVRSDAGQATTPGSHEPGVGRGDRGGDQPPVTSVQTLVQASKSVHCTSVRPSRQVVVGVFQYQTSLKYVSSAAWKSLQKPACSFSASTHACGLTGASPKYTVTAAFAAGEMM